MPPAPILQVTNLVKDFSRLRAVNAVSFSLTPSTITAVISPNGAGKTTLYHLISGELKATSGSVKLNGKEILGTGTIKWMGTMQELRSHPQVLESYLGV